MCCSQACACGDRLGRHGTGQSVSSSAGRQRTPAGLGPSAASLPALLNRAWSINLADTAWAAHRARQRALATQHRRTWAHTVSVPCFSAIWMHKLPSNPGGWAGGEHRSGGNTKRVSSLRAEQCWCGKGLRITTGADFVR